MAGRRTRASKRSITRRQSQFAQIPEARIQRSVLPRSHSLRTTFNAGQLIPIFVDEALPGDTMTMRLTTFGRMATPIHAVFENMYLDYFFFACPIRILWDNFVKMMGEQDNPGDSIDFQVPQMTSSASGGHGELSLSDYLGIPTKVPGLQHSALFHRCYAKVWNEWFRHQDLQNSIPSPTDDGPDAPTLYNIQPRNKRHDYFTAALPWPQKGPGVEIPIGTQAPLVGAMDVVPKSAGNDIPKFNVGGETGVELGAQGPASEAYWRPSGTLSGNTDARWSTSGLRIQDAGALGAYADLSGASSATINDWRQAFQLQRMLEKDARGGTRYQELIRTHFRVASPDQRLQRPEWLGGGTSVININPVAQTSSSDATSPQANVSAYGTTSAFGVGWTRSFTEHMIIIGMVSMRADLHYQQGLERMFSRKDRYDFYWPTLSHLGEQAILNKEIYAQGDADPDADEAVFGYIPRYDEYRYKPSRVTGLMRSNAAQSLDTWHLSQDFASLPALNENFIVEKPPIERIIAVPSEPHILLDAFFEYRCARPMPAYSVPGLIDHF